MSTAATSGFISSYSNDLQAVINRAVAIASLPLNQLQNQLQNMNDQSTALSGLDSKFSAVQSALDGLGSALGTASYTGSASNPDAVGVSVSAGAMQGSYSIDVTDIGSYSVAASNTGLPAVADPRASSVTTAATLTLTVDGKTYQITPKGTGLIDLAQAINDASAGVRASLVNTGAPGSPAYRLVVRSANLGPVAIQLNDGSQDLLSSITAGTLASYTVSGLGTAISSNSRTVTLAPGVTIDLCQSTSGEPVTVTVSRNADALRTALSTFVDAYNSAVDAVDQQVGKDSGPLSGQSVVYALRQALSRLNQFNSSGHVQSLAQMGVELDSQGKLSFQESQFDANTVEEVEAFLGSATGSGFLKTATDVLKSVEDPTTGSVQTAIQGLKDGIKRQNDLITENQQRVDDLQANLQQQMAAADALLAQLESQRDYITNLFTAMMNNNSTGVKSN
jgi:flagellar hook-associated protein 2